MTSCPRVCILVCKTFFAPLQVYYIYIYTLVHVGRVRGNLNALDVGAMRGHDKGRMGSIAGGVSLFTSDTLLSGWLAVRIRPTARLPYLYVFACLSSFLMSCFLSSYLLGWPSDQRFWVFNLSQNLLRAAYRRSLRFYNTSAILDSQLLILASCQMRRYRLLCRLISWSIVCIATMKKP